MTNPPVEERFRTVIAADARATLCAPTATDDKYRRGVVLLATGSLTYPGAAVLTAMAATRAGAGMVRYLGPDRVAAGVLAVRPEVVHGTGRYDCLVIGSGVVDPHDEGRADLFHDALASELPAVVDAGGLALVEPGMRGIAITPHARELAHLMQRLGLANWAAEEVAASEGEAAVEAARMLGCTVLLKGRVTYVVDGPQRLQVRTPNSWLATAGTGDVLAGIIGTVIAARHAREESFSLAATVAGAAWLHARAGWLASQRSADIPVPFTQISAPLSVLDHGPGGGPILAADVANALPAVVSAVLTK